MNDFQRISQNLVKSLSIFLIWQNRSPCLKNKVPVLEKWIKAKKHLRKRYLKFHNYSVEITYHIHQRPPQPRLTSQT